jgi:hypothetical protein
LVEGVEEKSSPATGDGSIDVKVEEWSFPVVIRIVPTVIRIIPVLDLVHLSLCQHEITVTTCKC